MVFLNSSLYFVGLFLLGMCVFPFCFFLSLILTHLSTFLGYIHCEWKKIKIIEAEVCPDHVHMLLEIPPKVSISSFMGYLKGKSSLMIYEKYPELKYKYRNREFWCRGYYVDTAGKNAKKIEEYIKHQLDEDRAGEQLTMGNY